MTIKPREGVTSTHQAKLCKREVDVAYVRGKGGGHGVEERDSRGLSLSAACPCTAIHGYSNKYTCSSIHQESSSIGPFEGRIGRMARMARMFQ